jgi:hypothetical protein
MHSNATVGIFMVRFSTFLGVATAILLAFSPVAGFSREEGVLLSPTDYDYLSTQGVQRNNLVLQKMSPKELYRLHRLISEEKTQNDPQARSDAIRRALTEFEGNQQWDKENPGQFWDAEKTKNSTRPSRD